MSDQAPDPKDVEVVEAALKMLRDRFDTVQIFVTRYENEEEGTTNFVKGSGDWFARKGVVTTWLEKETKITECQVQESRRSED